MLDGGESRINLYVALELFSYFPFQGHRVILATLYLASGKFPRTGQMPAGSALADQNLLVSYENGTDHFQHTGSLARVLDHRQGFARR